MGMVPAAGAHPKARVRAELLGALAVHLDAQHADDDYAHLQDRRRQD
jgi:hypothetical protein